MLLSRGAFFAVWLMIVGVSFFSFTSYAYNFSFNNSQKIIAGPGVGKPFTKTTTCFDQRRIHQYMKHKQYRIMFTWISDDTKLIKIIGVNKAPHVIIVYILDNKYACVIDELEAGTMAPKLFFDLFSLVPDTYKRKRRGKL